MNSEDANRHPKIEDARSIAHDICKKKREKKLRKKEEACEEKAHEEERKGKVQGR